jgi:type I restriction enzyme M protein
VGIPDEEEEDITFEEKMELLTSELSQQMREAEALDLEIKLQLAKVGFRIEG